MLENRVFGQAGGGDRPRVIYLPYDNVIFNRYQGQKFITSATLLLLF